MLPEGSHAQKDAGKHRPLICLGNNGDRRGRPKKGSIATCPEEWISSLAGSFRQEFSLGKEVAINNPLSGGFISNAHYWRKGVPRIQIEINRSLYESRRIRARPGRAQKSRIIELREGIWKALTVFWDGVG